jgi:hypothetical protein
MIYRSPRLHTRLGPDVLEKLIGNTVVRDIAEDESILAKDSS